MSPRVLPLLGLADARPLARSAAASRAPTPPARRLVHARALIDGVSDTVYGEVTTVVEGERIAEVVYRP